MSSDYYDATAAGYDALHSTETNPEHTSAMELGWPLFGEVSSVLDVGSGTGRSLIWLRNQNSHLRLSGIEPSQGMIELARRNLPDVEFTHGKGEAMPYATGSVDVAIATGIMHHADHPARVISEMFRVARKGILISDHNNYAFGGPLTRRLRMTLQMVGLLNAATFVRQGFKKRGYSDDDGWWYPYSLFDNYADIARRSSRLYIIPTKPAVGSMANLLFSQGHFCIVAIKD